MIERRQVPNEVFVGADPDLHNISYAIFCNGVLYILIYKIPVKVKGLECVHTFLDVACKHAEALRDVCEDITTVGLEDRSALIESQDVRYAGKTNNARPQDLIKLATMGGAMIGVCSALDVPARYIMPAAWKGTIRKAVHQARICTKMGWKYEVSGKDKDIVVPIDAADYDCTLITSKEVKENHVINKGEWKHVLDSIGLALFAAEQYLNSNNKQGGVTR